MTGDEALRAHFREALVADPVGAYREWFRAQEELRERGEARAALCLADDLWELLPSLPLRNPKKRARFLHNAAVFYGSPGPAADLARSRELFSGALERFTTDDDGAWNARALHNFATAIANLGTTPDELSEAVALFGQALAWRNHEHEIARGVTLHNMGLALRRLAELDPPRAAGHLDASAAALREAIAIRSRHSLAHGRVASERQLAVTLDRIEGSR